MPPIRTAPVKTERTHEENQERAYIAASRRSDRSLEARIESARRASEIHKKRTGRGLRVTEQDVINEEMYEEEDDGIPSQYQKLSAHLQSNSLMFNRKLQDYIATQAGVRQAFLQQYQNQPQYYSPHLHPNPSQQSPTGMDPFRSQQMLPPQVALQSPQPFNQQPQPFSPHGFRHAPYSVNQRSGTHQRSASIPTQHASGFHQQVQLAPTPTPTTPQDDSRRFSLPVQLLEQAAHDQRRPSLSRTSTAGSVRNQSHSPKAKSDASTPPLAQGISPLAYPFSPSDYPTSAQVLNINPLSMSLPPESQQFVGQASDLTDPHTAMLMAGSDSIAMPFAQSTYSYHPNPSKPSRPLSMMTSGASVQHMGSASSMDQTLYPSDVSKAGFAPDSLPSAGLTSAMSDDMTSPFMNDIFGFGGSNGDLFQNAEVSQSQDNFDANLYFNFSD